MIICEQDATYSRQNLTLINAYDTEQTKKIQYDVISYDDNVWEIAPTMAYESGDTYTAIADGDVRFYDYETKKLTFKIVK